MSDDGRMLKIARVTVCLFLVANLVCAAGFVVAIVLSWPFGPAVIARLTQKYGPGVDAATVLLAIRLLMVVAIGAAAALHHIFAGLLALLAAVRRGDPFTLANARRLRTIGWALLALQLLDLVVGAFIGWFAALHVHVPMWSPALGGWIAVLMAFVLAGVFARGAAMRDDLAMTV